jgi:uncharacterized protein
MKKYTLILFVMLVTNILVAQQKPVKIIFDVSSTDSLVHQSAIRHVELMTKSYKDSQFEVVIYSGALPMVINGKSSVAKQIQQLSANKNVSFKVCEVTMKRQNIDASNLIAGVSIVPDAILEIVTKQGEGWGYIKEAR